MALIFPAIKSDQNVVWIRILRGLGSFIAGINLTIVNKSLTYSRSLVYVRIVKTPDGYKLFKQVKPCLTNYQPRGQLNFKVWQIKIDDKTWESTKENCKSPKYVI